MNLINHLLLIIITSLFGNCVDTFVNKFLVIISTQTLFENFRIIDTSCRAFITLHLFLHCVISDLCWVFSNASKSSTNRAVQREPVWRIQDCHLIMRKTRLGTIVGNPKWRIEGCHVIIRKVKPVTIMCDPKQ